MVRRSKPYLANVVLVAALLCMQSLFAQGPTLKYLTDPNTDLGFAACYIYFEGGSRHKIPFLPIVNSKNAPCGSKRYSVDIRLKAPLVFVGDGIVRQNSNPYSGLDVAGKVVMLAYDFPGKANLDFAKVTMKERVLEAVKRKAAGVLLFSAVMESPFPRYKEDIIGNIPEIPIIVINKPNASVILAADGRDPDETFRKWETEGKFDSGELACSLDLRMDTKFNLIDSGNFAFAFQRGIPMTKSKALAKINEKAFGFIMKLFNEAAPQWQKTFTAYFSGYDSKVFFVHHWGSGYSTDAGNFMWFDGTVPNFGLAVHENTHALIFQNWGGSSSFLIEGIGMYAEAMATNKGKNHRLTQANLGEGKLFPLSEMTKISIGSDPRTDVAYPAAGSFVQFLIEKYSLKRLKEIYQGVAKAGNEQTENAPWVAVYGVSMPELEREWLNFLSTFQ